MFGSKKTKDLSKYKWGAIKPVQRANAPVLTMRAGGREERVDLRGGCSPVEDQGQLGSCTCCATVGILEFLMRRDGRYGDLSILYLYYNGRRIDHCESDDSGLLTSHVMASVIAFGACEDQLWPYDIARFTEQPPQACYDNAHKVEGVSYAMVDGGADAMKAALSAGQPLVIAVDMPMTYYQGIQAGGVIPSLGGAADGPPAGHCMLCVGYDDAKQTWLIRNSWGADFGDQGYIHLPYDTFGHYAWNNDVWAVGALEKLPVGRLGGASMQEHVASVKAKGPEEQKAALEKMRSEVRSDLESDLDAAKKSVRDRLRGGPDKR